MAAQVLADHSTAPRWALEFDGAVVGSVELALDHDAGVATLHYALARHLWRQGLMTEAVRSLVERVFSELPHIMRIASWADVRNQGSWAVMEKVGLRELDDRITTEMERKAPRAEDSLWVSASRNSTVFLTAYLYRPLWDGVDGRPR